MAGVADFSSVGEVDQSGFFVVAKTVFRDKPSPQNKVILPDFENRQVNNKHNEIRLWISHILSIEPNVDLSSQTVKFYKFNNQLVNIVNIYGVVSGVITNRFGISYSSK